MSKLIEFNPNNKQYYSEEFIKGFEVGAKRQFEADSAERKGHWIEKEDPYGFLIPFLFVQSADARQK